MAKRGDIPPHISRDADADEACTVLVEARHVRSAAALRAVGKAISSSFATILKLVALVLVIGLITVFGRSVSVPERFLQLIESRVNSQFVDAGMDQRITVRRASFGLLGDEYRPTIVLDQVQVFGEENAELLVLPEVRSQLDLKGALRGQAALRSVTFDGGAIQLERDENGQIVFALGQGFGAMDGSTGDLGDVLGRIDALFERPVLRELDAFEAKNLSIRMLDRRTGDVIQIDDGAFTLRNQETSLSAELLVGIAVENGTSTQLRFAADKGKGRAGARLVAEFAELSTKDLASQVGALNWLGALDAPAAGQLTAEIDGEGNLSNLDGALNIGAGAIKPGGQAVPLPINGAFADLSYSVATGRLFINDINVDAPEAQLSGRGHLDLRDLEAMVPQTILAQLKFNDIRFSKKDLFDADIEFETGTIDMRYRPALQEFEIGQFVLRDGLTKVVARGKVSVEETGWRAALDAQIAAIAAPDLVAMWPKGAKEKTRNWLDQNIIQGDLTNVSAALRLAQGEKPRQAVTFDFADASVRYMKTLPPIEKGLGYGAITGNQFVLNLYSGIVKAPDGSEMNVEGSTLEIPDMAVKPAHLEVDLKVKGDMQGALALLDEKPFEFLSKSGLHPKIATGHADIVAQLFVPLVPKLKVDAVGYQVSGDLKDVRSDVLVKDRVLTARNLTFEAGDGHLVIGGQGQLDGVPMDVIWSRAIGKGSDPTSKVAGWVELSPRSLDAFGVSLPQGLVSGKGRAEIEITLAKDTPPQLQVRSDLIGVGMRLDALGWRKTPNQSGVFSVEVSLDKTPKISGLQVEAAGLSTRGSVRLREGGGFDQATFSPLRVAGRFNSDVRVIGRGRGRPVQIEINGGRLDVRQFGVSSSGPVREGPPIKLALDQLIISDGIALQGFSADFSNSGGLRGPFRASVNGQAPISGVLSPTAAGPAIDIQSGDAGAVMRGSGIFKNAKGGEMTLRLLPTGRPGEFNGTLKVENTRVVNAPSLAELLVALSVIGLMEQLGGEGIPFSDVQAEFVLGKSGVTVKNSSAVGASMGISMEGIYDTSNERMNLQGVISPIYAVNGLFGALFSPRRGEGLFGFNYTLTGSPDDPQVGVNPLSMLTPGIFREIFRQPPPKL